MYLLNGKKISIDQPFNSADTKYPHLKPQEWRDALGVVEVPDPVLPDPETDTYIENVDGSITVTPIPLEEVKKKRLREFRRQASDLFDRKYDLLDAVLVLSGQAPTPYTATFKAAVLAFVTAYKTAATAVNAATTATDALAVMPVWPV